MWLLILVAVHINNPKDQPAWAHLSFKTEQECISALSSLEYWVKFQTFKVEGKCIKSDKS